MSEQTKKNIVAKMHCTAVVDRGDAEEVYLTAVYSPDPAHENYQWSKWTPAGSVTLTISNPEARGAFVQGKEYFVNFTPVPEEPAEQLKRG